MDASFLQNFYCKVDIDGHQLIPKNIITCAIREWIFDLLPRLELSIFDDGYLTEIFPIKDDSVITISIGTNPSDENIKTMFFDVADKVVDNVESNKSQIISITGILKTNNCFFPIKTRSFKNKTSPQVIEIISNEIGLNFQKSLGLSTTDLMNWLQIGCSNFEFIKHVLKRSYLPNDILLCYADIDSNLHLNSFKSILNATSIKARYSVDKINEYVLKDSLEKNTIWYKSFNVVNYTNLFNKFYGYGMMGKYYNSIDSVAVSISEDFSPFTNNSYNSNSGKFVKNDQMPIYTNNIHSNYFKAKLQNVYFKNLFNYSALLDINALSKVKLFDKVDLVVESLMNHEKDEVQSGEYIVGGIVHSFGNSTLYKKQISIHRNGFNSPQSL